MMFSRTAAAAFLMAVVGVAAIPCGNNNPFTMSGSSAVVPVAKAWAAAYTKFCGNSITVSSAATTSGGGSIEGAQAVCGAAGVTTVDIGLLNRPLNSPSEAVQNSKNPYLYTCSKGLTSRQLVQVQVAVDGIALLSVPNGIAARCIASLAGGGLTFSQVRYIFSSLSLAKLKADPFFDPLAIPGKSASGNTRPRSLRYGKLSNGSWISVPPALIPRRKNHYMTMMNLLDVLWGTNGFVWIQRKLPLSQQSPEEDLAERQEELRKEHAATPVDFDERQAICRFRNAIECLRLVQCTVSPENVQAVYELSSQLRPAEMLHPQNILELTASMRRSKINDS